MIHEAAASLGYSSLKREQLQAIQAFMSGQDVFVSLPTGFSKSLCSGILPRLFDLKKLGTIEKKESIVIVVSPLKALMFLWKLRPLSGGKIIRMSYQHGQRHAN